MDTEFAPVANAENGTNSETADTDVPAVNTASENFPDAGSIMGA
jgi:hypothetical protein